MIDDMIRYEKNNLIFFLNSRYNIVIIENDT